MLPAFLLLFSVCSAASSQFQSFAALSFQFAAGTADNGTQGVLSDLASKCGTHFICTADNGLGPGVFSDVVGSNEDFSSYSACVRSIIETFPDSSSTVQEVIDPVQGCRDLSDEFPSAFVCADDSFCGAGAAVSSTASSTVDGSSTEVSSTTSFFISSTDSSSEISISTTSSEDDLDLIRSSSSSNFGSSTITTTTSTTASGGNSPSGTNSNSNSNSDTSTSQSGSSGGSSTSSQTTTTTTTSSTSTTSEAVSTEAIAQDLTSISEANDELSIALTGLPDTAPQMQTVFNDFQTSIQDLIRNLTIFVGNSSSNLQKRDLKQQVASKASLQAVQQISSAIGSYNDAAQDLTQSQLATNTVNNIQALVDDGNELITSFGAECQDGGLNAAITQANSVWATSISQVNVPSTCNSDGNDTGGGGGGNGTGGSGNGTGGSGNGTGGSGNGTGGSGGLTTGGGGRGITSTSNGHTTGTSRTSTGGTNGGTNGASQTSGATGQTTTASSDNNSGASSLLGISGGSLFIGIAIMILV